MSDQASNTTKHARAVRVDRDSQSLIGRDAVLAEVLELAAAARGRAVGVVITGDPGVGKTALLDAVTERASGFRVLRAAGVQVEAELPFAGLQQMLGPILSTIGELPGRQREILEHALGIGTVVSQSELAVAAAVLGAVGAAAEAGPLLIVVDDLQWVDRGTLDAILFAFRRLRDQAIGLIVASRPHGDRLADVERSLAPLADFHVVRLPPLDPASARSLVHEHLADQSDSTKIDRIVALGGGLPLALIELAHSEGIIERSATTSQSGRSVEQLVARLFGERIARLTPGASAATLVAALDEPTEQDAFLRAGEDLSATASDWELAERSSIITITTGRVDFVHPLLREAAVSRASPAERRQAHRALATAMESRGDRERALMHRAAGAVGSDAPLAAALERAADVHRARAGHPAAARALMQSARLSDTSEERARRLVLTADAARRAGEAGWAESLAVEARAGSRDPLLRARAELIQAHIEARRGSTDTALRRYERVADQTLEIAPDLAALALSYASSAAAVVGDVSGAVAMALRADGIAVDLLSPETTVAVRECLGSALALSGETTRAHMLLDQAAAWYERQVQRVGAEYVAEALTWLGDFTRARRLLDDVADDARRLISPGLLVQALELRADLGYRTGDWSAAVADANEAVSLAQDAGQDVLLAYSRAVLAILLGATGAEQSAREIAHQAREGARQHQLRVVEESASFALAALELAGGNPEAALLELAPTSAAAVAGGRAEPAMCLWPAELIESMIAADRRHDAERMLRQLDAQARRTGGIGPSAWSLATGASWRTKTVSMRSFGTRSRATPPVGCRSSSRGRSSATGSGCVGPAGASTRVSSYVKH